MGVALEVRGLRKGFRYDGGWLDVLADVSFHIGHNEFVTLLGPSGCGKTTVCNIVAGLIPPDAGAIRLDGEDAGPRRGRVAYMQQKDLLLPWRTVLDNALLALEIQGAPRGPARREAREMLRRFGLEGFERAYPAVLSGGMRQRVALVRTLLSRRDLLVLDEPFGALDAMTRRAMQGYLRTVQAEFGKTVLFITHDVEEAVLLSDRIYILTPRPARIRAEVRVDLPRPRRSTDPGVVEHTARLLGLLELEEVSP